MISPASSVTAAAVAYSGGILSTPQPGFGAALAAKLAEFQTVAPGTSLLHRHRHEHPQSAAMVNQDAGGQAPKQGPAGWAPAGWAIGPI